MSYLELDIPRHLPSRNAVATLHQHIIEQITRRRPAVGDNLLPAEELAERFGISRSTMNRVLEGLQREGWIERRAGCGTFVGIRASTIGASEVKPASRSAKSSHQVRLAVTVFPWGESGNGLSQALLEGLDLAVQEQDIAIELIGQGDGNYNHFARRLAQSHPNALIILKPTLSSAPMIREAERLGIPCILTGTRLRELGRVTVQEDGQQGMAMAVRYLADQGHRRIGLILPDEATLVYHDRRHGYLRGLKEAGLPIDQNLILWASGPDQYSQELAVYLDQVRPTAVVLAAGYYLTSFQPLVQSGRLCIPRDLSLIAFDQWSRERALMIGGPVPTMIELPAKAMMAEAVRLVQQMLAGQQVPVVTSIPCSIIEGQTVLPIQN